MDIDDLPTRTSAELQKILTQQFKPKFGPKLANAPRSKKHMIPYIKAFKKGKRCRDAKVDCGDMEGCDINIDPGVCVDNDILKERTKLQGLFAYNKDLDLYGNPTGFKNFAKQGRAPYNYKPLGVELKDEVERVPLTRTQSPIDKEVDDKVFKNQLTNDIATIRQNITEETNKTQKNELKTLLGRLEVERDQIDQTPPVGVDTPLESKSPSGLPPNQNIDHERMGALFNKLYDNIDDIYSSEQDNWPPKDSTFLSEWRGLFKLFMTHSLVAFKWAVYYCYKNNLSLSAAENIIYSYYDKLLSNKDTEVIIETNKVIDGMDRGTFRDVYQEVGNRLEINDMKPYKGNMLNRIKYPLDIGRYFNDTIIPAYKPGQNAPTPQEQLLHASPKEVVTAKEVVMAREVLGKESYDYDDDGDYTGVVVNEGMMVDDKTEKCVVGGYHDPKPFNFDKLIGGKLVRHEGLMCKKCHWMKLYPGSKWRGVKGTHHPPDNPKWIDFDALRRGKADIEDDIADGLTSKQDIQEQKLTLNNVLDILEAKINPQSNIDVAQQNIIRNDDVKSPIGEVRKRERNKKYDKLLGDIKNPTMDLASMLNDKYISKKDIPRLYEYTNVPLPTKIQGSGMKELVSLRQNLRKPIVHSDNFNSFYYPKEKNHITVPLDSIEIRHIPQGYNIVGHYKGAELKKFINPRDLELLKQDIPTLKIVTTDAPVSAPLDILDPSDYVVNPTEPITDVKLLPKHTNIISNSVKSILKGTPVGEPYRIKVRDIPTRIDGPIRTSLMNKRRLKKQQEQKEQKEQTRSIDMESMFQAAHGPELKEEVMEKPQPKQMSFIKPTVRKPDVSFIKPTVKKQVNKPSIKPTVNKPSRAKSPIKGASLRAPAVSKPSRAKSPAKGVSFMDPVVSKPQPSKRNRIPAEPITHRLAFPKGKTSGYPTQQQPVRNIESLDDLQSMFDEKSRDVNWDDYLD